MTLAGDLLTLLQQDTSGDVTGHGAVWRIAGNARAVQHCKSRLLGIICAQADIYIRYDEAPEAEPALARAQAIDRDTWWLPAPTAGADVQAWLQPGNSTSRTGRSRRFRISAARRTPRSPCSCAGPA